MEAPEDKEEILERVLDSSTPGKPANQQFVYPTRSRLGPVQPYGDNGIIEAMLSPPIKSAQVERPERTDERGSEPYSSQFPGKVGSSQQADDGRTKSHILEDGFTFRHFPNEGGEQSFDSRNSERHRISVDDAVGDFSEIRSGDGSIPHQTQERPNPTIEGGMSVIKEINIHAPQPLFSSSSLAKALQEAVDDSTPSVKSGADEITPPVKPRKHAPPSQMSSNDADDESGISRDDHLGSVRTTSSLGSSEIDFASAGLVHLAPIERLDTQRRTQEWRGKLTYTAASSSSSSQSHSYLGSAVPSKKTSDSRSHSHAPSSLAVSSIPPRIDEEAEEENSQNNIKDSNFSSVTTSSNDMGPVITMRFEHREDEDGHHVMIGREGKLMKCEDEPIRIPGAIQGFGVLMVIHDDRESRQMKVRQVSENSKVILGLSAKYLFSLECLSHTLSPSQADILWDNLQFLGDPDLEEEEEHPQVFLLSGWGEANSAPEEGNAGPQKRRQWTCWVAGHRLRNVNTGEMETSASGISKPGRKLIVLEFELENDVFNPLYPPPGTPDISRSDDSSPFSSSSATVSGTDSIVDTTRRDTADGHSMGNSTPSNVTPVPSKASMAVATHTVAGEVVPSSSEEEFMLRGRANLSGGVAPLRPAPSCPGIDRWRVLDFDRTNSIPSAEAIIKSTTSRSKPLKALERMRRFNRTNMALERVTGGDSGNPAARSGPGAVGTMDVFTVLQEVNEQMERALDLLQLLDIVVGIIKDLTQFHRVLCYQFDDAWNGQVVAELVDWSQTRELFMGLHFPASDIPAQARELYAINRVRLLYDRSQSTARIVVKDRTDLEPPVDMTHCYLRAMSPIHIKYLGNMGVRASMSISIVAFNKLWGLITCHSYGNQGMRVSFPVRQMLRLLSDSISRNVERLSYARRLRTRKLISTVPTDQHPTGYIVSNSEDLLTLFDADCGVLVIGEGAKILGPNEHGQDILLLAEYLRVKQFTLLQVSQSVMQDYPDLQLPSGLDVIAGLLYVPLSMSGKDFIALLRKGQTNVVNWAGRPHKTPDGTSSLEPRKSFKLWTEKLTGRCRAWTDEQLDTAAVLALVYGKFIEVWRQKESAMQMNQLTTLLLSNASHEVRTPLHQIIKSAEPKHDMEKPYIPYAATLNLLSMGNRLDKETRENLTRSHAASKALLFTINDLLDLTRLEAGKETSFNEPFDLHAALNDAVNVYRVEATRRQIDFQINLGNAPRLVVGDARKIKTVIANLTSNAVKYTQQGSVSVTAHIFEEPDGLRALGNVAVEIIVSDTGCGIQPEKLESIFREFEQVDKGNRTDISSGPGLGLGLAVVARVVEQLGGQLRVDSKIGEGSRFSCLLPFPIASHPPEKRSSSTEEGAGSGASNTSEIDSLVEAISSSHMAPSKLPPGHLPSRRPKARRVRAPSGGKFDVEDSAYPVRGIKVDEFNIDSGPSSRVRLPAQSRMGRSQPRPVKPPDGRSLRILVVEDDVLNARVLKKRLNSEGHDVVSVVNGQQAVDLIENDRDFDCVLMDIQMPILDGFGATKCIRKIESISPPPHRSTTRLGRIPIFAVSASLTKDQRPYMIEIGMDGWILKPIDFKRMSILLAGISSTLVRAENVYCEDRSWEYGGWLESPSSPGMAIPDPEDISPTSGAKTIPSLGVIPAEPPT